jgi:hypothetical protein
VRDDVVWWWPGAKNPRARRARRGLYKEWVFKTKQLKSRQCRSQADHLAKMEKFPEAKSQIALNPDLFINQIQGEFVSFHTMCFCDHKGLIYYLHFVSGDW